MVVDENVDSVNDLEARVKLTTQNFHMHLSLPGLILCFICAIKAGRAPAKNIGGAGCSDDDVVISVTSLLL